MPYISYNVKRANLNIKLQESGAAWGEHTLTHVIGFDAGAYPFFLVMVPRPGDTTVYDWWMIRVIVKEPLKAEIFSTGTWTGSFRFNRAYPMTQSRVLLSSGSTCAVMFLSPSGNVTFGPTFTLPTALGGSPVLAPVGEYWKNDTFLLTTRSGSVSIRGGGYAGRYQYAGVYRILGTGGTYETLLPETFIWNGTDDPDLTIGWANKQFWVNETKDDIDYISFWNTRYYDRTSGIGYRSTEYNATIYSWNPATATVGIENYLQSVPLSYGSGGPRNVVATPIYTDPNNKGRGAHAHSAFDNVYGYDIESGGLNLNPPSSMSGWTAVTNNTWSDAANAISQGPIIGQVNWMPMQMPTTNDNLYIYHMEGANTIRNSWYLNGDTADFANGYVKGMVGATWGDRNTGERWFDIFYSNLNIARGYIQSREYLDSSWDRTYAYKPEYFA